MKIAAIIPAYQPSDRLLELVRELSSADYELIVVVNDGSDRSHDPLFAELGRLPRVAVISHAVNLGKGAALKTGINHALCQISDLLGVITVDADGQHLPRDVRKVAEALRRNPESLILGVRGFDRDVPWRSWFGNTLTKFLFRLIIGQRLTDTQTGLRGIPRSFLPLLLKIELSGYEFELEMLLACKYASRNIVEVGIETVYLEGNASSHFNPLVDSMRIYFVLFRFTLSSLLTAAIDYSVFCLALYLHAGLAGSQIAARLVALFFNYTLVKRAVFYSNQKHGDAFPKYVLLVCISGVTSYLMIKLLAANLHLPLISAKVIAESIIFFANFAIQRDFIFTPRKKG